jgi:hypothetical protein
MSEFHNFREVFNVSGMKQAAIQHGIKLGEIDDDIKAEDLTESTWGYIVGNLFKEECVCVFYLNAEDNQQSAERVYLFLGKFFQMDGNDFIGYPGDDLKSEIEEIFDILDCHDYLFPDGYTPSVSGDVETEYLLNLCTKHIKIGNTVEVNGENYLRTTTGFELKK